jgi:hypothetical protein
MLSPETLASRPAKDAKFAQLVGMGLVKGRTKAGWAQARRPGKRDRDAAKKRLVEDQVVHAESTTPPPLPLPVSGPLEGVVEGIRNMAVVSAHAHAHARAGAGAGAVVAV